MSPALPELTLTPHGHLVPAPKDGGGPLADAFALGPGHGLLYLGANQTGAALPPVHAYWRDFGGRYVTAVCTQSGKTNVPPPSPEELEWLVLGAPPMAGAEYLTAPVLESLWRDLDLAFEAELARSGLGVQEFLKAPEPGLEPGGPRALSIWPKIARTRRSPFAFLATYTTRLVGARQGAAPAAGRRRCASMRARRTRTACCRCCVPVQRAVGGLCPG